ncbi:Uncharacterised protein [Chlamydia abortus]|nr:hypothetical protein [Chlamydia abortus]CAG9046506.1 hypothetical protein NVRI1_00868 [Chlamydia abortus]SFV99036.1 Uncharacterised protein [Chlamydia abortus]SFW00057.1 Uncharacterised protein [Chlamydia abortus]SFW02283.1 Uncharacterised protein [Chlamydia abortus]
MTRRYGKPTQTVEIKIGGSHALVKMSSNLSYESIV